MIPQGHKQNLDTIIRAAENGALAVVECFNKRENRVVNVLCAIGFDGKEYAISPFAQLFDDNPYDILNPPDPDGGFAESEGVAS